MDQDCRVTFQKTLHNPMQSRQGSGRILMDKKSQTFATRVNLSSRPDLCTTWWSIIHNHMSVFLPTASTARRGRFTSTKATREECSFTTIVIGRKWTTTNESDDQAPKTALKQTESIHQIIKITQISRITHSPSQELYNMHHVGRAFSEFRSSLRRA